MILNNASLTKTAFLFLSFFVCSSFAYAGIVQLPETGQTISYYAGDDGDIRSGMPWPNPRFSSGGTGCRTDNLTGLTWAQNGNLPGVQKTWEEALAYIVTLNGSGGICGHTDWRLPNLNELATLINANEPNSATWLNAAGQGFNSVQAAEYWTSTTYAGMQHAWTVYMWEGNLSYTSKTSYRYILPVRGTTSGPALVPATGQTTIYPSASGGQDGNLQMGVPLPNPRFQDNGDGTATDALTGLVWLQDANCINTNYPTFDASSTGGRVIWARALDFIDGMNNNLFPLCDGGHHDWRLPNKNELRSLINYESSSDNYFSSLIALYGFSNIQSSAIRYWSSTTRANSTSDAWTLYVGSNTIDPGSKTYARYLWPVRSAPKLLVTPSPTFDYGTVHIGDTKIQTFTITNAGSADLVIDPINLTGIQADFQIINNHCSYATIAPGGSCTVDVQYWPGSTLSMNAFLEIPSNDLTVSVNLTGTGAVCTYVSVITYKPLEGLFGEFTDIQSAYNDPSTDDNMIIAVRMIEFHEALNFAANPGKIIKIEGGYDCDFYSSTYYSTIIGSLTITSGKATIENIVIQ